jgi:hypothetical protein
LSAEAIGIFVMIVGTVWGIADVGMHNLRIWGASHAASPYPWVVAGAGLTSVGLGYAIPADPVSLHERIDLARGYNARVRLRPTVLPGGGGLTLGGQF